MSIKAEAVSKFYGNQKALDKVSFAVNKGEIVALLGPNGAGKSTMMKIISCFLPQNEGKVSVCGFDVINQAMEVKKRVGYLPEHNPLYLDMYVKEYLMFIAGIHKLGNSSKERVNSIITRTGLEPEKHKKLGQLSKGYRQRVGLAQALIHNPEVLILDEPTSGLDPNQIVEIRSLIKEIGKEKTVLLSTHIMQEVEALCSRVIIINNGRIAADAPTSELQSINKLKQIINIEFQGEIKPDILKEIDGVIDIIKKENTYQILSNAQTDIRPEIFNIASSNNWVILSIGLKEQSLEDVFRQLTIEK
ncbi:MAG: gliding motility-associated ABC transporter ATP-binding subunit GldA [Bacteroidales bacterium]